jgi:hypothetical protein
VSAQELAVENPVTRLEHVVFGQSKPVLVGDKYRMVRDPFKVLSGAFSGHRHYKDYARFGARILKQVALGELALARGVPVLQPYFAAAVERLVMTPDLSHFDFLEGRLLEAVQTGEYGMGVAEITSAARASFAEAWGISVEEQKVMEATLPGQINFPRSRYQFPFSRIYTWRDVEILDGPDGGSATSHDSDYLDRFL